MLHNKYWCWVHATGRKKKAPPPPPVLKAANSLASLPTTTIASTPATETITPVVHASNKAPIVEPKPEGKLCNYYQTVTPLPFKAQALDHKTESFDEIIENIPPKKIFKDDDIHHPSNSKKLSIFVSPSSYTDESDESYSCFITEFGKILDSRVGELV